MALFTLTLFCLFATSYSCNDYKFKITHGQHVNLLVGKKLKFLKYTTSYFYKC